MGKIRILEDRLVNQIAAGEVVERPASVVKELVENALDAGASRVVVRLASGGRQLIEVIDDGEGMDEADALMCLERHGTSKIRSQEDLFAIDTLGFRGEAIPSIASVSRLDIISRQASKDVGVRVAVHGGTIKPPQPAAGPVGTQVTVRDLFFNLPVRRKFLRTVQTELSHCIEAVVREALVRPDVDWTVEHDGHVVLRLPAVRSRVNRAAEVLGELGGALFPLSVESGSVALEALLSPVGVHQASAVSSLYLYVNGRFVREAVLRKAVTDAYRQIVPKGRYPVVVLEVRVPADEVDVNVHPSKIEVRFRDGIAIGGFVSEAVRDALSGFGIRRPTAERFISDDDAPPILAEDPAPYGLPDESPPPVPMAEGRPVAPPRPLPPIAPAPRSSAPESEPPARPAPSAEPPRRFADPPPRVTEAPQAALPLADPPLRWPEPLRTAPPEAPPESPTITDPTALLPVPRFQDLRVIGQLATTYILCEGGGELVIIDQHAAHERVTLHRLRATAREQLGGGQRLLTPIIVELPAARARALEDAQPALAEIGLDVEPYGPSSFAIRAVPPAMARADLPSLLRDLADEVSEGGAALSGRDLSDRVLATMACHNSIRAHQTLSAYEMRELLRALDSVDFSVCAHGRPVAIRVDQRELERRFHRA